MFNYFFFISLLMLFFKSYRFIFILISLEFFMMCIFFEVLCFIWSYIIFFFMCHSVISSILGIVVMVSGLKFFGSDNCIF
uniref:NADH dehydrogenase subunit 4L n=1 Tax=Metastrongylus pudendotectus TaxID=55275 RepID=D3J835_METPU|nr:NADH dehydrogenase subunit 4L [Metastrongylus pudendotectus]ACX85134.1 NADH dehydrogenase subunit 4L [Metastrongylus pudendotectus]